MRDGEKAIYSSVRPSAMEHPLGAKLLYTRPDLCTSAFSMAFSWLLPLTLKFSVDSEDTPL